MPVIRTKKLIEQVGAALPSKGFPKALHTAVAGSARAEWIRLAQTELNTTSRDYVRGIQEIEWGDDVASIALVGMIPHMVENGWGKRNLIDTLVRNPNAKNRKQWKNGVWYNIVPFRHGTPGTGGRNVGRAMPTAIYNAARKLNETLTIIDDDNKRYTKWGERLVPRKGMRKATRDLLTEKLREHHTTSIYRGMVRQAQILEDGRKQSRYTTFRTIHENSKPPKWEHPGIKPHRLVDKVRSHIKATLPEMVRASLDLSEARRRAAAKAAKTRRENKT